ncbi:hypothetical protein F4553_007934 [Allocatelliglobosispora scoriae]|uniref:Ricin B lectin domain-containing protein n=1 Tax=Allocatelliglobosispora scoriae TaxID=643052 RepID=A0A841C6E1_9ACTN|nr:RICIN domain-containing protein [Allocatelliglobosispora scoriae]MBB5874500.1 hypothetical protein [Allocatelliglobosispora scoriae]
MREMVPPPTDNAAEVGGRDGPGLPPIGTMQLPLTLPVMYAVLRRRPMPNDERKGVSANIVVAVLGLLTALVGLASSPWWAPVICSGTGICDVSQGHPVQPDDSPSAPSSHPAPATTRAKPPQPSKSAKPAVLQGTVILSTVVPSGKCIAAKGSVPESGTAVVVTDCVDRSAMQQWTFNGNGTISLTNYRYLCIIPQGLRTRQGTPLEVQRCEDSNGDVQRWQVQPDGAIVNVAGNICIDDPYGIVDNGTQLGLVQCQGGTAQQYKLVG